ncbi:hypothetical protein K438DRAFT_1785681 [Mycena galopus ATCC 62051]|nr:hypothetical protein K438DRAFT_1785681 [Mycena galopus ATCC 62051]
MESTVSINLNTTIGAYEIGVLASYILFGAATAQTYIYYSRFPADSPKLKALVAAVWVCELVFTICIGYALYLYTIAGDGHPEVIFDSSTSIDLAVLLDGLIAACVQGFYSFRIYTLSTGRLYIPTLIWTLTFIRLLACFILFVEGLKAPSMAAYKAQWQWLVTVLSSVSAANDWTITGTLCFILHNRRSHAGKSVSALATVACSVTMKGNFIFFGFYMLEARLFSNSLLASLNSREALRALNDRHISLSTISTFKTPAVGLACNSVKATNIEQPPSDGDTSEVQYDAEALKEV